MAQRTASSVGSEIFAQDNSQAIVKIKGNRVQTCDEPSWGKELKERERKIIAWRALSFVKVKENDNLIQRAI